MHFSFRIAISFLAAFSIVSANSSAYLELQSRIVSLFNSKSSAIVRVTGVKKDESEENKNTTVSSTGFVVSSNGYVLTSSIPVDQVDRIFVEYKNGTYLADLVGVDFKTRLALLQIKEFSNEPNFISLTEILEIPPVGNFLIPISRRYGQAPAPYLSSLLGETSSIGFLPTTFIRTNIQMAKGEPGSPVFDLNNRLVGVLVAYSKDVGESLIIPAYAANRVVEDLKNFGQVQYGWIGLDVDLQVSLSQGQRILVKNVDTDGPADKGGLRQGDRIIAVNDQVIKSLKDLQDVMFFIRPGAVALIRVIREGEDVETTFAVDIRVKPEVVSAE